MAYSKEEVLAEAIRNLLIADIVDTTEIVREIMFYITNANKVRYSGDLTVDFDSYPVLTFKIEGNGDDNNLPTGNYLVQIMGTINANASTPQAILKRLMSRVDSLINKKSNNLNTAVSSKNLRCRVILKTGVQEYEDFIKKVHRKLHMFSVQCDDEILTN